MYGYYLLPEERPEELLLSEVLSLVLLEEEPTLLLRPEERLREDSTEELRVVLPEEPTLLLRPEELLREDSTEELRVLREGVLCPEPMEELLPLLLLSTPTLRELPEVLRDGSTVEREELLRAVPSL